MVKTLFSSTGGAASIPGWGAEIPHVLEPKDQNIKQKHCCNKICKHFKKMVHVKKKYPFSWSLKLNVIKSVSVTVSVQVEVLEPFSL